MRSFHLAISGWRPHWGKWASVQSGDVKEPGERRRMMALRKEHEDCARDAGIQLKRVLCPGCPDWSGNSNPALALSALPPELLSCLRRVWARLNLHQWDSTIISQPTASDEWLLLLKEAMKLIGSPRGPKPVNAARDKWIAARRERRKPMSWEDIYLKLLEVGPRKGWNIPSCSKALSEAYRRSLKREREAE
jgi:hypothetical protein